MQKERRGPRGGFGGAPRARPPLLPLSRRRRLRGRWPRPNRRAPSLPMRVRFAGGRGCGRCCLRRPRTGRAVRERPPLHEGGNRCCISEATWEDGPLCECLEDGRSTLDERREGDMSEQERERVLKEGEDPDVEAHKAIRESDDSGAAAEAERVLKEGDEPDVEAHNIRKP